MKRHYFATFFSLFIILLLLGCGGGKKIRKAESVIDSPAIHYQRGQVLLEQEKFDEAMFEFNQAVSLDPKYAPAYEGMSWVYLEKGDLDAASKNADKALDLDGKWVLAKIVKARVKSKQGKHKDAIKDINKAIKNIPKSTVPDKKKAEIIGYMSLGQVYKEADMLTEAEAAYYQVLSLEKTNMAAENAIKKLTAYKFALAGQREELKKIAGQEQITRADVAVLFVLELPLNKIFRQVSGSDQTAWRAPGQSAAGGAASIGLPPDVPADFWARSFIQEALEKGIMEVEPDDNFSPNKMVNRAELSRLIEKFLVRYWNNSTLETKFFGQPSPFRDVNNTSPIFNAIVTVSSRGIMNGFDDGTFKPLNPVSGFEAINIVRRLKSKL